ncbi:MAG: SPFH domain-containing protein [Spartobacteria bacterium]|nr:SPFH domain-containing protein [Spartobacteria bacterium]
MGLWNKIVGQFIDVIEWSDAQPDLMVWKFPRNDNEIKNGAQLIVREGQAAVFLHEGQLGDVFGPGRHELNTSNIPVLTSLASWKYAFNSPFKCDVFFVAVRQFTDLKWGTQNPIMMRDAEFGPIRFRAFGSYCVRVKDAGAFIKQISGIVSSFSNDSINGQFRNMLVSRFADALGEAGVPALDLAGKYNELGEHLRGLLQPEFEEYGVDLTKFLIENISLPPEVEKALDKRTQMGVLGDLNNYTKFQTANAIGDMANNPAGPGMMGMVAGMGMGHVVGSSMQQSAQPAPAPAAPSAGGPPPLPDAATWYAAVNGQQQGPMSEKDLKSMAAGGQITRDTLVWSQGMAEWTPAAKVVSLSSAFTAPPPMPG